MPNFRYRVDDKDIILSEEEHQKFTASGGKQIVFLRDGTLAINPPFVRYVVETEQPTDLQIIEREKTLRIDSPPQAPNNVQKKFQETKKDFYNEMGWN